VRDLTDRELGLKLLLTKLPDDIQTAVPEINDFYNVMDSEMEQIKKKILQSEKLLQNILPPVISRRLKNGERIIADTHPNVTVVFAALIGFDEYSKTMEARQIVHFLNGLIVTFDHIVDLLDLEKIKTIGDVYFLCGGLTAKTEADHPLRCMECSLLFFDSIHENNVRQNTPNLTLRVGINTDPAVAGVIGSKKVAYDLWGDSVNTSSRMQSTGMAGKIQVSDKTYKLIKEFYSFTDRTVSAKGKGELKTHIYAGRIKPTPYSNINWKRSRE
jgi:class 3 adenylate cyclase